MQPDETLPPYTSAFTLANETGEFFAHRITSIKAKLIESNTSDVVSNVSSDVSNSDISFSEFSPMSEDDVHKLAIANGKSCAGPNSCIYFISAP